MNLSVLIWLPAVATLVGVSCFPRRLAPAVATTGAFVTLALSVVLLTQFDLDASGLQFVTDESWIESLGIHYKLGVDGLNVLLLVMTTLLFAAAALAAALRGPLAISERKGLFFFQLGLAESAVLGAFCAQDLALFVGFFDLMLVPFYFITGIWGSGDRRAATLKFVIYTLAGSLLMLAAAVTAAVLASEQSGGPLTFVLSELQSISLPQGSQEWLFLLFAAAFLVKMPAFPLHGWMPDAYRAMPLAALAVFSAVLSKVAAYGFLRVALPLFPSAADRYQTLFLVLAVITILYGSLLAIRQSELRLVLGYSSIAQLGFITLGIFSLTVPGQQGALLQMVNHGLVVAPLFFILALLAARAGGSEDVRALGGIALRAPVLAAVFLVVALATLAVPGSANFAGEFLILLGAFKEQIAIAIVASIGVVLTSVYMLRAFIGAVHNRSGEAVESREINLREGLLIVPLTLVILAFALYPQFGLKYSERSTTAVVTLATAQQGLVK